MGKKKVHLRFVGLQPRTLKAYRVALSNFERFLKKKSVKAYKPRQLDAVLSEYLNICYQEGDSITYAGHLLSAIKRFFPEFKLFLPTSSQFYRNWSRSYTPVRATPASWELVEALIAVCWATRQRRLGLLLGLAFHCMLRTSEFLAITSRHILIHPRQQALSVVLPGSKTSMGNPQVLQVEDPHLVAMASQCLPSRKSDALLYPQGPAAFRAKFQSLLSVLHFPPHSYQPYSLRRGGATWFYQASLSLDLTLTRGRWACQKTCRQYIDSGTMQLAHLQWTAKQSKAVRRWRAKGMRLRQE